MGWLPNLQCTLLDAHPAHDWHATVQGSDVWRRCFGRPPQYRDAGVGSPPENPLLTGEVSPSPSTPKGLFPQSLIDEKVHELFPPQAAFRANECVECGVLVAPSSHPNHAAWHLRLDATLVALRDHDPRGTA
ncbi:MAG TPA: hypothetical protein VLE97_07965 [Gaiellaceae bacterium]|nr:hypothetical protein [Gaiellaceae bacterium]